MDKPAEKIGEIPTPAAESRQNPPPPGILGGIFGGSFAIFLLVLLAAFTVFITCRYITQPPTS